MNTGDGVWIRGADQTEYNGWFSPTVTGGTTFTMTVSGAPASPATGTITMGREWSDWDFENGRPRQWVGTLTTRTDDTNGEITLNSSAHFQRYLDRRYGSETQMKASWSGYAIEIGGRDIKSTALVGDVVTVNTNSLGLNLPVLTTEITLYPATFGFQELDLDVDGDLDLMANWSVYDNALDVSLGGDTLPDSLYLAAKPALFGSLTWPPFDSTAGGTPPGTPAAEDIPAGYFYTNGSWPTEAAAGTLTATTVNVTNINKVP
jgi:hypothetical protein